MLSVLTTDYFVAIFFFSSNLKKKKLTILTQKVVNYIPPKSAHVLRALKLVCLTLGNGGKEAKAVLCLLLSLVLCGPTISGRGSVLVSSVTSVVVALLVGVLCGVELFSCGGICGGIGGEVCGDICGGPCGGGDGGGGSVFVGVSDPDRVIDLSSVIFWQFCSFALCARKHLIMTFPLHCAPEKIES